MTRASDKACTVSLASDWMLLVNAVKYCGHTRHLTWVKLGLARFNPGSFTQDVLTWIKKI